MRWSVVAVVVFAACTNPPAERSEDAAAPAGAPGAPDGAAAPVPAGTASQPAPGAAPAEETGRAIAPPIPSSGAQEGWTAGNTTRESRASGAPTLVAVRTARQPGYDRTVFEFAGDELPGYHIEYVDRPVRQCGSGEPVPLPGDAWLLVRFNPANAHTEEGRPTVTDRDQSPDLGLLKRLRLICDYEAYVEWVLALAAPNPYRVLELSGPTRLVLDVQHYRW